MENQNNSGPNSSHHNDQPADPEQFSAELNDRLTNDSGSIGLDIDGTNPGSRSHPIDYRTLNDFPENDNPENKDLSEGSGQR